MLDWAMQIALYVVYISSEKSSMQSRDQNIVAIDVKLWTSQGRVRLDHRRPASTIETGFVLVFAIRSTCIGLCYDFRLNFLANEGSILTLKLRASFNLYSHLSRE